MYKLSYEKCVCFVFLVILVFLSCSGFHTDRLVTLTDHNKKHTLNDKSDFLARLFTAANFHLDLDQQHSQPAMDDSWPPGPGAHVRRRRHPPLHHQQQQQQQVGRARDRGGQRRGRKFCQGQDVGTRAYNAKIIIEGRVRSSTSTTNRKKTYAVTVEVKKVHRNDSSFRPLNVTEKIRLHFAVGSHKGCDNRTVNGYVTAQLVNGKEYIFFLESVGTHNYSVTSRPVPLDRKKVQELEDVLRNGKVKEAVIDKTLPANKTLKVGEQLKLICTARGFPPPVFTWQKDGSKIRSERKKLRIRYFKKKSVLVIPQVNISDTGRYECQATGVIGNTVKTSSFVTVQKYSEKTEGIPCPPKIDAYCLNGGTCLFLESLEELACSCSSGFKGQRCEHKDVTSETSMYTPRHCKLGLFNTYYC